MKKYQVRLNAVQMLAVSFAILIFCGGILLSLPVASQTAGGIPFLNALFVAGSASCVTGLSVYDTGTTFSAFGQLVILCLIQIGGLSFMTISMLVTFLLKRQIGLHQRTILMDTVGALQMGSAEHLTRRVLGVTFACEGLGAVLLAFWFIPRYGAQGIWFSIFHAVSAFCNAGFDLLGTGASLASVSGDWYLNTVLMLLIICGGLGFLVWDDILTYRWKFHRWQLHSKIAFTSTIFLFILGTMGFFLLEHGGEFTGLPLGERFLRAAFQSVTCRTAGFTTIDQSALSGSGTLLTMILMAVGAGSGSTGGGIKVNTITVLLLVTAANIRQRQDVNIFQRRLDEESIRKAYSTCTMFLLSVLTGCMILCTQGIGFTDALYECISAMGTVGLTRNITPSLPVLSKIIILCMMFIGRVGSMSVVMAMTRRKPAARIRNIPEKILIG